MEPLPESIASQIRGPEKDLAACTWMDGEAMDFAFVSEYDGFYGMTRDLVTLKQDDWDSTTPGSLAAALHDTGKDLPAKFGDANRLNNPTNFTYGFKTREGGLGLLQITSFTGNPPGAGIRYKLFQPATNQNLTVDGAATPDIHENLMERLDAASSINDMTEKSRALATVARSAALAGEVEIVKQAIEQTSDFTQQSRTAHDAALLLAQGGWKKPAIEIAKNIDDYSTRNRTLSELAQ